MLGLDEDGLVKELADVLGGAVGALL